MNILNINYIVFTLWDYKASLVELLGIIFNFFSIYLMTIDNVLNWPIGIVGSIFFATLFYQVQLYSEVVQQVFFFIAGFYGWWMWSKLRRTTGNDQKKDAAIQYLTIKNRIICGIVILIGSLIMGYIMQNISSWLPRYSLISASFPYLDAFVVMSSFIALFMISNKKIESWYLFAFIYAILMGINWSKELYVMVIFFILLFILAVKGIVNWHKMIVNR